MVAGIFAPMPMAFRIADIAFFGGGGVLMLAIGGSRQLALRVDARGVTLGGVPPRHRSTTTFVPWADIESVVLWKQVLPPFGRSMPYIGLVRRPGAPALAGPPEQRAARGVSAALALPVSAGTLSASRAVNGWRLDGQRLAAAIHQFAPGVPLQDGWNRPRRAERGSISTVAAHTWFEIDPGEAAEMSDAELAFAAALRAHSAGWAPPDADGYVAGLAADGLHKPLIAYADLTDPATPDRFLLHPGVHLVGDRVRGDRLHSQLFSLPERPSSWALDCVGPHDELAELCADWFRGVLGKPIVLYVWLHDDYAYAARYAFADTGETLIQCYEQQLAPAGQATDLIAAGHVHGKGWIQTTGLPEPSCYLHIRGDLAKSTGPPQVPVAAKRGPLPRLWYE